MRDIVLLLAVSTWLSMGTLKRFSATSNATLSDSARALTWDITHTNTILVALSVPQHE